MQLSAQRRFVKADNFALQFLGQSCWRRITTQNIGVVPWHDMFG